jgi:succinate dehydrogenase / fumarate reductase cytochrome b subunit
MKPAAHTAAPRSIGAFIASAMRSSVGMKVIMAITGLGLLLFLISHVISNLQIFVNWESVNAYGAFLKGIPELLWTARIGLLVAVGLHIWAAVRLSRLNHAARPQAYKSRRWREATWYSRYMLVSGAIVFGFIVFHLLHFTGGVILPEFFSF